MPWALPMGLLLFTVTYFSCWQLETHSPDFSGDRYNKRPADNFYCISGHLLWKGFLFLQAVIWTHIWPFPRKAPVFHRKGLVWLSDWRVVRKHLFSSWIEKPTASRTYFQSCKTPGLKQIGRYCCNTNKAMTLCLCIRIVKIQRPAKESCCFSHKGFFFPMWPKGLLSPTKALCFAGWKPGKAK